MLKARCLISLGGFVAGSQYSRFCYNDIQVLYGLRGVAEHVFPYVGGALRGGELVGGAIEYPVLTGLFMWAAGLPADSADEYLLWSAVLLAPFALVVAWLLWDMTGSRALLWSAAPALVLYAFHNWDLLAVAAASAGLWAWWRGRPLGAAALMGVGGALKLYPLLFAAPLTLAELRSGGARAALRSAGVAASTFAAINLPFVLAGPEGWWATWAFHSARPPNYDSVWTLVAPGADPATLGLVSGLLVAAGGGLVLVWSWRRPGRFPVPGACGSLLAAFLLFNKVHSPQYTLWLLPFFALLGVRLWWWAAYAVVDALVYFGIFRWFYEATVLGLDETPAKLAWQAGVAARAVLLAGLAVAFLVARPALRPAPQSVGEEDP